MISRIRLIRLALAISLVGGVLATGCGSDQKSTSPTNSPSAASGTPSGLAPGLGGNGNNSAPKSTP